MTLIFVRVRSFVLEGIEALPIEVEIDLSNGIPSFDIVGLPDAAVRESRERVRAAIKNGGWRFPTQRITVNLAPAYTRKGGAGFDLAIAIGVLAVGGEIDSAPLNGLALAGELALDGSLRPVRGALVMALAARGLRFIVPDGSGSEASLAGGEVFTAERLSDVVEHLKGRGSLRRASPAETGSGSDPGGPDLSDVKGQLIARRAIEVAAAGAHNLLMIGPPGSGKSLLARCLPSILPPLSFESALEVSRIHSAAGLLPGGRLIDHPPYRAPHHCASRSALLGGGSPLRPGEVTLAHRGVLFLDELPEFRREVLEGLRQPIEDGRVLLSRVHGTALFPSRPMLVAAANPCPCGYWGDQSKPCTCPAASVSHYRGRLSGPLLDRFDIQLRVAPVAFQDLVPGRAEMESSAAVRERVRRARRRQAQRNEGDERVCNAHLGPRATQRGCFLPTGGADLMRLATERYHLTLRGYDRVLRVARTIADLADSDQIELPHLAEALQYRAFDRLA